MSTPEQNEKIDVLIKQIVQHKENSETELAKSCAKEILEIDPENLDGHILFAYFSEFLSDDFYQHLKFVMDRDFTHLEPFDLRNKYYGYVFSFLSHLKIKSLKADDSVKRLEVKEEIIYYIKRLLGAKMKIPEINDFVEELVDGKYYDDVINVGYFLTNDKTAEELGWPGLELSRSKDDLENVDSLVMTAFFQTKRYEEGCRWIYKCVQQDNNNFFFWFYLGETLAWLGYPEETARAWTISVEKGFYYINERNHFYALAKMVSIPDYEEKERLFSRFYALKDNVPAELKYVFEDIVKTFSYALNYPDKPVPSVEYIEDKLGLKLEDDKRFDDFGVTDNSMLFVSGRRSNDPVVKEVIDTIDNYIGAEVIKTNEIFSKSPGKKEAGKEKEKVTVGGTAEVHAITISQFGLNITDQAAKGEIPPIIGREREIERMVRILARSEKNNPVLLGEAGVGKTAAVYGLAQRIVSGDVPEVLKNKTIFELNVGSLIAGTTYRGDFEQRMENIIKEMREDPDKILFIDEFHTLIGAGDSKGQLDASNILKPALSAGEIRLIGATTSREYSRSIEHDAAFERRFSPVWLNEVSPTVTFSILKARIPHWQKHHGITITDEVLHAAIQLTERHIRHRHFPDKAIDLIDEACALVRTTSATDNGSDITLKTEHVKKICDQWIGTTTVRSFLSADFTSTVEHQLQGLVIGHTPILNQLSILVTDEKLGLYTSKLPRVIYFYGFPDSGKSECGRALAKVMWPGEKDRCLFINMELLSNSSDLNRLVGSPSGTIGSEEGGILSVHISQFPNTIVYLYNFHKAHEHIIRFFTTVFKEGLFTNGSGSTVYAGNVIFIVSATILDGGQRIGYTNGPENVHSSVAENDKVPDVLKNLNLPKDLFNLVKSYYFFSELDDDDLQKLVKRKIHAALNQPGIRELAPKMDDGLAGEIVRQYRKLPPSSRNLRGLLQKYVYEAISV